MTYLIVSVFVLLGLLKVTLRASASPSSPNNQQFRSDPYKVLHVDPSLCSQKDIQRQYRKLCLKHHPDKKRNDDCSATADNQAKNGKGGDDDFEFKEVQHAYSLLGTEEDRRNYDTMRKFNRHSSTTNHDVFSRYAAKNSHHGFGERDNMSGPSSGIYFTFGDGLSFKLSSGRHDMFRTGRGSARSHPFFGTNSHNNRSRQRHGEMSQQSGRPHYIQKVSVPLHVLYAGGDDMKLKLKTSMFERYQAALKGGILKPVLMQSALTVLLTWLRSQRVNWFLSLFIFVSMVHMHIPPPPERVIYSTNIQQGWKGGTKIKYQSSDADVTFVVQESTHDTFTRVGNNLHTQIEVSARQLRKGCTLTINPLCESEEPIKVKLRPKEVKNGQIVTIKSRGWPSGSNGGDCGDLKVKIYCHG